MIHICRTSGIMSAFVFPLRCTGVQPNTLNNCLLPGGIYINEYCAVISESDPEMHVTSHLPEFTLSTLGLDTEISFFSMKEKKSTKRVND